MADIQYLNYGDLQIELLALLNTLANLVQNYVAGQPWSTKRKEKFMSAYTDIINRGILGANSNTGNWQIQVGGTPIEYLNNKDKEMYEAAAYFIQQLMASLSKSSTVKKEEKSDLPVFSNELFLSDITKNINNDNFGGLSEGFKASEWNEFDERDSTGKRGRTKRAQILASQLEKYRDSLSEEKYNFKDSSFGSLDEFKTRLNSAISALNSPNETDDKEALLRIGIRESDWFNNGLGDFSGKVDSNGNLLSYAQLAEYNLAIEKQKLDAKTAELEALVANRFPGIRRYNISKLSGTPITDLSTLDGLATKLSLYLKLDGNDLSKIAWAIKSGVGLEDLSREEFTKLPNQYRKPNRLKKISGLEGIYVDTVDGSLVLPYFTNQTESSILDIMKLNDPQILELKKLEAQQTYLNNTEWTSDLWRELGGIAADVASVIDPEPVTAGGLALTGTGLRTYNRATDADGFTWTDAGHTALDAGLSLLGMIPVVGDAALAARIVGKLLKAAGWMGAIFAAASVPLAAKAAWNKVVNGKDMTVDDWRAIGNVLMGATQARRIQLNRAAGRAVKNLTAGTKKENFGEIEVKVNGKTEKVEISELAAKELLAEYKKAGNNLEETSKALRNSRAVREQLEAKTGSDGKPVYTKELLDTIEAPQAALGSIKGKVSSLARTKDIRGIKINNRIVLTEGIAIPENAPLRVLYMLNNKGFFKRGDYGWNLRAKGNESDTRGWFRRQWDKFVDPYNFNKPKTVSQKDVETLDSFFKENPELRNAFYPSKAKLSRQTKVPEFKNRTINEKMLDGSEYTIKFDNNTNQISVILPKDSKLTLPEGGFKGSLHELKALLGKWIAALSAKVSLESGLTLKKDSPLWQAFVKSIKDLKRKGYLFKLGGKITDSQIDNFLKQYK